MRYRIRVPPDAKQELRSLPGHVRQRFVRLVDSLAEDPIPPDARPLDTLPPGFHRIRVDRFRLVYRIEESGVVWILRAGLKVGPEFYEDLPDT